MHFPQLEGFMVLSEAAHILGVSRQQVFNLLMQGRFPNTKVLNGGSAKKYVYLLTCSDVQRERDRRDGKR